MQFAKNVPQHTYAAGAPSALPAMTSLRPVAMPRASSHKIQAALRGTRSPTVCWGRPATRAVKWARRAVIGAVPADCQPRVFLDPRPATTLRRCCAFRHLTATPSVIPRRLFIDRRFAAGFRTMRDEASSCAAMVSCCSCCAWLCYAVPCESWSGSTVGQYRVPRPCVVCNADRQALCFRIFRSLLPIIAGDVLWSCLRKTSA